MKKKNSSKPKTVETAGTVYPEPSLEASSVFEGKNEYDALRQRTKKFALRVINLSQALPVNHPAAEVVKRQILRSGTSVGANYRAACRAKSNLDFINKMKIVEEETDESMYWMELIQEAEILPASRITPLYQEADEILRIVVQSILTARKGT
jgi:four helix bundle protein